MAGGSVVVTRFSARSLPRLLYLLALHLSLKRDVLSSCPGCVGAAPIVDWRSRTMFSVSLWRDIDAIYDMGEVTRHVAASRIPRGMGIKTRCGIYTFTGDWRRLLFDVPAIDVDPLSGASSVEPTEFLHDEEQFTGNK